MVLFAGVLCDVRSKINDICENDEALSINCDVLYFFCAGFLFPLCVSVLVGGDLGYTVHSEGVERLCHEIHPQRSRHRIRIKRVASSASNQNQHDIILIFSRYNYGSLSIIVYIISSVDYLLS